MFLLIYKPGFVVVNMAEQSFSFLFVEWLSPGSVASPNSLTWGGGKASLRFTSIAGPYFTQLIDP